jgi:hypothetical protein
MATRCAYPDHHYTFADIPSLIGLRAGNFDRGSSETGLLAEDFSEAVASPFPRQTALPRDHSRTKTSRAEALQISALLALAVGSWRAGAWCVCA